MSQTYNFENGKNHCHHKQIAHLTVSLINLLRKGKKQSTRIIIRRYMIKIYQLEKLNVSMYNKASVPLGTLNKYKQVLKILSASDITQNTNHIHNIKVYFSVF